MLYNVIILNPNQANDFIKKYMQDHIKIINFSKDDEHGIYFVTFSTGKLIDKKITSWQFRHGIGLCFGETLSLLKMQKLAGHGGACL